MANLDLNYDILFLGTDAEDAIRSRLDAGLPALFYLWSPHPITARPDPSRIQLPKYTPPLFKIGRSDYPIDVLEKVASSQLAELVPDVAELYSSFQIDNWAQETMLADLGSNDASVILATCAWIRSEENAATAQKWFQLLSCENSAVWVEGDAVAVPPSGHIRVRLAAYEAENVPMKQTRAEVEFRFGEQVLPVQWSRGSNLYGAEVSADLTQNEGEYELEVVAIYARSNTSRHATSCILFRRMIIVKEQNGVNSKWVLVGHGGRRRRRRARCHSAQTARSSPSSHDVVVHRGE
jgi:hypothetical protein